MTNKEKQALIAECQAEIREIKQGMDELRNSSGGSSILRRLNTLLQLQEIVLAALTAQPVKLPQSFYGVIQGGKVVMLPAEDGQWLNRTACAEAICAAGYEVIE